MQLGGVPLSLGNHRLLLIRAGPCKRASSFSHSIENSVPMFAGKSTLLQILAGQYMVGPEAVRILGRPAFHDIQLTSSGQLSYLGQQWRRDIAFAGYNVPIQVRRMCATGIGTEKRTAAMCLCVPVNVKQAVRNDCKVYCRYYGHMPAGDSRLSLACAGLLARSTSSELSLIAHHRHLTLMTEHLKAAHAHTGRHRSGQDDLWGGGGGSAEAAAAHRLAGD